MVVSGHKIHKYWNQKRVFPQGKFVQFHTPEFDVIKKNKESVLCIFASSFLFSPLVFLPFHYQNNFFQSFPTSSLSLFCLFHSESVANTQPAIKCLKLTIETLEQGVEYVQSSP